MFITKMKMLNIRPIKENKKTLHCFNLKVTTELNRTMCLSTG